MKRSKVNLVLTLFVTFVLMTCVVIYTSRLFYRISVTNIYEAGDDKITGVAASLENYLDTAKSVLWVTADTVEDMIENGDSTDRILEYLTKESKNQEEQFDENYTGIYGYIQGTYLDGIGWEPPEGYKPTERDWYISAKAANGETTIVAPYVDAQTNSVIISISKLLKNGTDVLSLDLTMNQIQAVMQKVQLKDKGYGFVLDQDGMIVAHHDVEMNGKIYTSDAEHKQLMEEVEKVKNGNFSAFINGKKCTVFTNQIMEQWYVVIVVSDKELFADVWSQLLVNISVFLGVFLLIVFFYLVAYRNEQKYSRRMEDLKVSEQKKEYEAKVLKLEKSAADAANNAKSSFLAEMSHEIRTPINAILVMNEMILREAENENIIEYSGNVQSAGRTLLSIINSILDFSKIEDGKMEIVPVKYDVASMIHDLVNSILERVKAKGLELKVDIDEAIPSMLYGDDVRISQIIMNLLTNAVKYTNEGTVTFSVRADGREAQDIFLQVEVRDTGIGIKEEDMDKLFESFGRLEEKRNRHIEGTGLGMAIVTKLLAMMDSELKVESVYGEGSVFSFCLRQPVVSEEPIGNYAKRLEKSAKEVKGGAYLFAPEAEVLVVDDNEMNRKVAFNLMKRNGIKPELLASGVEAIERVREKTYDIIFLDHMMPTMDGIETLEHL
ncbi:MAG: response regulator, partial [Lachnospiraceae bacterium]|nr:response regulator [Lachnospiraceae bacterium]